MKCCICDGEIDKHYTPEGKMYWDQGHNPDPVKTGEDDRCCDNCNSTVVLTARLVGRAGMSPENAAEVTRVLDKAVETGRQNFDQLKAHNDKDDPFRFDIGGEG